MCDRTWSGTAAARVWEMVSQGFLLPPPVGSLCVIPPAGGSGWGAGLSMFCDGTCGVAAHRWVMVWLRRGVWKCGWVGGWMEAVADA